MYLSPLISRFAQTLKNAATVLVLFVGFPLIGATETETAPGIVDLPKFEVTERRILPPLERWHYLSIPGYEILSNASSGITTRFVKDFYLLQQVARILVPQAKATRSLPTYIVLCAKGQALTYFMPDDPDSAFAQTGSLFVADSERTAIVINFSPSSFRLGVDEFSLDDEWDSPLASSLAANDPFRFFYREYFRSLVRDSMGANTPRWLEEGMTRLFSDVEFSTQHVKFAHLDNSPGFGFRAPDIPSVGVNSAIDTSPRRAAPSGRALMPSGEFFVIDRTSVLIGTELATYLDQTYLFTHMCLYGRNQRYQDAYFKLALRAQQGPITEEVFREYFKMSFADLGVEMRGYSNFTDYKEQNLKLKEQDRLAEAPPFTLRDATDAESGRIAGEVLRLSGHQDASLNWLIAPYIRGDRSPDLLAALGLAELSAAHTARARKFLEAAVAEKTTRTRAYLELGKLRFDEVRAKAATEKRAIDRAEIEFVTRPLDAALTHPPSMVEVYDTLARVWIESPVAPTAQQYAVLLDGARRYPRNFTLIHNAAAVGVKHAYVKECRPLVAHGLKFSPANARDAFKRLEAALPPEAASIQPAVTR
jgi:hypothetical protein